ncbi:hypothetical protein AB3480_20510 [Rhizobium mongolense]|uniref:hypothetical protein n=1 Tax=Rhizobium mongolense TaxID=57676 RepID=UPI0034A1DB2A
MLKAMREHADKQDWDAAASIAKDAAPYMHAKLASIQHTGRGGGPIQTVDLTNVSEGQLNAHDAIFGPPATGSGDDEGCTLTQVDWLEMGESWSPRLEIYVGGPRQMQGMGLDGKYKALLITANELK